VENLKKGLHPEWLIPQWPAPKHIQAVFTTRAGGHSRPPFDALNLGDHVGDLPVDVASNRATFQNALAAKPVFVSQVHGLDVVELSHSTPDAEVADASLTSQTQLACTIMVADCLPVLLTNKAGTRVAAAHAGWRSLAGGSGRGILELVFKAFSHAGQAGCVVPASEIIAWLGPCIGPERFEVGPDVRDAFVKNSPQAQALFTPHAPGKWLANLPGLARMRLAALGITEVYGNDGSRDWCTVSQPSRFFSHRRDGVSGRMAACIWIN
jgi:YfiH family protein